MDASTELKASLVKPVSNFVKAFIYAQSRCHNPGMIEAYSTGIGRDSVVTKGFAILPQITAISTVAHRISVNTMIRQYCYTGENLNSPNLFQSI